MAPRFLLSDPSSFDVRYAINPYMDTSVPVDHDLARQQWQALRDTLVELGATVEVQAADETLPDMVYTNNAAFVWGERALVSRFHNVERQGETAHDEATLGALGFQVERPAARVGSFEGAAEAVPFAGTVVCSHGERTSPEASADVARLTGTPTLLVELVTDELYHLDVAFCPLNAGTTALVAPHAFSPADREALLALVPDPILLEQEEATSFCANAVVVDRTVLMHHVPARVARELAARGFEAREQPVGEFVKGGGSVRCMSLRLDVDPEAFGTGVAGATAHARTQQPKRTRFQRGAPADASTTDAGSDAAQGAQDRALLPT